MHRLPRTVLLLLTFLLGCGASQVAAHYFVPPARADVPTTRWEYHCVEATENITHMANQYGQQGWELTAAAGAGWGQGLMADHTLVWCFKRPLP